MKQPSSRSCLGSEAEKDESQIVSISDITAERGIASAFSNSAHKIPNTAYSCYDRADPRGSVDACNHSCYYFCPPHKENSEFITENEMVPDVLVINIHFCLYFLLSKNKQAILCMLWK